MTSVFRIQSLSKSVFERSPTKLRTLSEASRYGCNDLTLDAERAYKLMLTFSDLWCRYRRRDDPVEPDETILYSVTSFYSNGTSRLRGCDK